MQKYPLKSHIFNSFSGWPKDVYRQKKIYSLITIINLSIKKIYMIDDKATTYCTQIIHVL